MGIAVIEVPRGRFWLRSSTSTCSPTKVRDATMNASQHFSAAGSATLEHRVMPLAFTSQSERTRAAQPCLLRRHFVDGATVKARGEKQERRLPPDPVCTL